MTNNITTRWMLAVVLFPALALLLTAQPPGSEEKASRELTSGSPLELNTFAELNTTSVESTTVFRVDIGGVPDMVVLAEYGVLRAGLRFPSHYFLEDAYINQKGKRVVRLQRDHEYRDYRFFAISSEVESVTWDDYR